MTMTTTPCYTVIMMSMMVYNARSMSSKHAAPLSLEKAVRRALIVLQLFLWVLKMGPKLQAVGFCWVYHSFLISEYVSDGDRGRVEAS